jgi:ParB family chromosome partitioning protein
LTPPRVERHTGLGRGLGALIPQTSPAGAAPVEIPISRIRGNPYQPRQRVEQHALESLAASIAIHGVLQPVLVTEVLDGYQLVAGERRVRAAQMAGLDRVPAIVRQMAQRDQLAVAIVENVQRADLNAMEEAHAYRQLADEFGLTQDEIATRVGRARSTVANTLRLLDLEQPVQQALAEGNIAEGHARALAGASPAGQRQLVEAVIARDLSVRQTEELVRRLRERPAITARPAADRAIQMDRLEEDLRQALGTKVLLARSRNGGRIVIEYYSDEEFSRLFDRLTGGVS